MVTSYTAAEKCVAIRDKMRVHQSEPSRSSAKHKPASSEFLSSSTQAKKPFVLGRRTCFRIGNPRSAAYFWLLLHFCSLQWNMQEQVLKHNKNSGSCFQSHCTKIAQMFYLRPSRKRERQTPPPQKKKKKESSCLL